MPYTTMKHCERDLLALMAPFRSSEEQDAERQTEARALLACVGDILESGQDELISTRSANLPGIHVCCFERRKASKLQSATRHVAD